MRSKTTIMIDEEILKALKKKAIDQGLTYGELIQKAVEEYLTK